MGNETSKGDILRKTRNYYDLYLHGNGIDIGCGNDPLVIPKGNVMKYDKIYDPDNDANTLNNIQHIKFDFVYSSHCLEHLDDPYVSFLDWIRVCKKGGYLYIIVPDETLYEKNTWPSKFSGEHQWSFRVKLKSKLPNSIFIPDLLDFAKEAFDIELVELFINDTNYDYSLSDSIDQTRSNACCQIEFILKKL